MALTRDERKLLHQKSNQPTFGSGKPDKSSGNEGDVSYRKIQGSGTVQYLKQDGNWVAVSSSGEMPPVRSQSTTTTIISGGGGGVTDHSSLTGLSDDNHTQYVLVNGTRAFGGNWTNAGHTIADLGTVTTADINGGNIDGMTIATSDIDVTGQTLSLDDNQISGDKVEGGAIDAITISQLTGAMNANSQSMTNVNIDSGAIDAVTIGTNSVATQIKVDNLDLNGSTITSSSGGLNLSTTTSGDINLDIVSGNLYLYKDGDTVTQTLMSVDDSDGKFTIDTAESGDIVLKPAGGHVYVNDGVNDTIELDTANPSITIKDDSIPADNFKIDVGANAETTITTVDADSNLAHLDMNIDGNFTVDAFGSITLDVFNFQSVTFKEGGTDRYTFGTTATPLLAVNGTFTLQTAGSCTINGKTAVTIQEDSQTLFEQYGFHNKVDKLHQTSGFDDLQQNYSILSVHRESTSFNNNFGS